MRQGGEQLRRCIAGGGLRGRYAEDHGEQGFRAARGGQQVFTGGLPGARFGEGFVPRSRSAYFSKHGVEGVGYAPRVFGEGRQMFPAQFAEGAAVFRGHLVFGRGGKLLGQATQGISAGHRRIGPIQNGRAEAFELRPATEAFFNSRRVG